MFRKNTRAIEAIARYLNVDIRYYDGEAEVYDTLFSERTIVRKGELDLLRGRLKCLEEYLQVEFIHGKMTNNKYKKIEEPPTTPPTK